MVGGAGFLGSRLVTRLRADGCDVISIDPMEAAADEPGRSLALVLDASAVPRLRELPCPDLVYQLAGSGSVSSAEADPLLDLARTVESTEALLYALQEIPREKAPKVILVSSAAVYGEGVTMPISEDAPLRPVSIYGGHKLLAEELTRTYGRVHRFPCAIVRFFSLYGAGLRKQLPWEACVRLSRGPARFGGTGAEERDWLHVDDAVELLVRVAGSSEPALVVNGGSGIGTRVETALAILASGLPGASAFSFSGEQRPGNPRAMVADLRAARSLGFTPRVALAEGLGSYARWFATLDP